MDNLSRQQWEYLEEKYISRTQKCVPDKFREMCHMHLAFLLDLSGDKLEQLLAPVEEGQTKRKLGLSTAVNVFKKKEKGPTGLFGAPVTDEGVCLMLPLIRFLKCEKNVCKEGLFRKPGNRARMNALREALNLHGTATRLDPDVYTPYDVAGVLKEFLRELPEPLLTDKHMEAHRQIQEMGKHTNTEEGMRRSTKRKLSALQLLMLLMPCPSRRITLQVLWLLQRVGDTPETKMTPSTLGTIFAPIFFLNRKVDAQDMCSAVSQAEPALAFMIEHAHLLFKAPVELVIDLASYWNCLETGSPLQSEVSRTGQIKKSTSGRTLNTNICYLDREASRCEDVASNTQAELDQLFAHVQSLPDTPHNMRIKKQLMKATTTPTGASPMKRRVRSKSISASIKKRLPSLGRSKNRRRFNGSSTSTASSGSSTDSKGDSYLGYRNSDKVAIVHYGHIDKSPDREKPLRKRLDFYTLHKNTMTPSLTDLLKSPSVSLTSEANERGHRFRSRRKRHHSVDALSECTPPKQESRESSVALTETPNANAVTSSLPNVVTANSSQLKAIPPGLDSPACSGVTSNTTEVTSPAQTDSNITVVPAHQCDLSTAKQSNCIHSPVNTTPKSKTVNKQPKQPDPSTSPNENKNPAAKDENMKLGTQESVENVRLRPGTPMSLVQSPLTLNSRVFQKENEITYIPQPAAGKVTENWLHERNMPLPKKHSRPCNAPGTPVMPRSLLRLAQCDTLETSI